MSFRLMREAETKWEEEDMAEEDLFKRDFDPEP
jgi:hypothetical protein